MKSITSGGLAARVPWGPSMERSTAILMAVDANFAVTVTALYGLVTWRDPFRLFRDFPGLLLLVALLPVALLAAGLYRRDEKARSIWFPLRGVPVVAAATAVYGAVQGFVSPNQELAAFLPVLGVAAAAEVVAVRALAIARARREQAYRNVLVVGGGWAGNQAIDTITRLPSLRMRVAGIVDNGGKTRQASYRGVPVIGGVGSLRQLADRHDAGTVIVATPPGQDADLIRSLLDLKMRGVDVVDMPSFYERATGQISINHVDDLWFLHAGGFDILRDRSRQRLKRMLDVVFASFGLVVSLPLMAVVALLVKLDSRGPVFFLQERVGLGERPFRLVKFRSMVADAEARTGPVWAGPADYRVTRVGRFLRLTRIDELPQFFNVIRGEMSFIGPRPERAFFVERLKKEIPYYAMRFAVKPGLSGWAQVNYGYGSSTEDAIQKLTYDLYYIKNMSFLLDLRILLRTVQVVLFARGN